ncbi:MAG: HAD family hydrolase [Caldilineaceae bacterium]
MAPLHFGPVAFDAGLIIFDKDGTLAHFEPIWQHIYLSAIDAVTKEVDNPGVIRAELNATLGYTPAPAHPLAPGRFSTHGPFATAANAAIGTIVAAVLYRHSQPPLSWDEAVALAGRTFLAEMDKPLDPALLTAPTDLPTLFGSLRAAGIAVAVITSDERAPTLYTLEHFGLGEEVEFIIASDDPYPKKPAPEAIWAACAHYGVPVERAVMVGDSLTDMRMGRAAGVGLCVGVLTGPASREELETLAHVVLASIGEITGDRGQCRTVIC